MKKKACFSGFEVHQRVLVRDFLGCLDVKCFFWSSASVGECWLKGVEFGAPNFKKHATRVPT
jgi:hypothetical protein